MPEKNNRGPTDVSQTGHDVAVLGGGSFGSAMAKVLGENGHTAVSYTHLTLPTSDLV